MSRSLSWNLPRVAHPSSSPLWPSAHPCPTHPVWPGSTPPLTVATPEPPVGELPWTWVLCQIGEARSGHSPVRPPSPMRHVQHCLENSDLQSHPGRRRFHWPCAPTVSAGWRRKQDSAPWSFKVLPPLNDTPRFCSCFIESNSLPSHKEGDASPLRT